MKWLQYMVDRVGKIYLPDILGYYVDIGWISEDIRLDLIEYSKGIVEDRTSTEPIRRDSYNLPTKNHIQSFLFIQKLKGKPFDERFVGKLEREIEKMAKSLDGYQIP
jgi:archaellum component FlaD/FlaE